MQITKADFTAYVKFTGNIHDNDINPFIQEAIRFLPRIKSDIYYQLQTLPAITVQPYRPTVSTDKNAYVEYQGKLYRANEVTAIAPDTPHLSVWSFDSLQTVFHLYLKPYVIYKAYDSFLLIHGINVTPAGLTRTLDREAFEHIDAQQRANFITSLKKNVLFYYEQLMSALKEYNFLDQAEDCKPKLPGVGVYVLGKKHKRGCGCGCNDRITTPRNTANGIFDQTFDPSFD